jgi:hypothetical protein
MNIPDDDDRIYFINTDWLRENVVRLPDTEPMKFDLVPTDDPDKYQMRITAPLPQFLIKGARINGN